MDVTPSVLAADISPSRLQRARHKVHDVMRLAADHQLGLVAYAGSAHRVTPLSHDRATLINLLGALEPGIMPVEGNSLGAALELARKMIDEQPPASSQILLMISSSEPEQLEALERHAAELGPQLAILGIGSQAGAPVPSTDGGFLRDSAGRILVPRLDSKTLAAIARRHGSAFHVVTTSDADLDHLLLLGQSSVRGEEPQTTLQDQGHWLLLLLLPLAALGARRGWLGVLLLASLAPFPAEAAWIDWWQRPDQQGAALLNQQRPAEAAKRFEDPAWRGWALYQAQRYPAAAEAYANVIMRNPDDPEGHFHYGTALAMAGRYEDALEAFEQALTRDPDHEAARHNRSRVEAWLERLREQTADGEADPQEPDGQEPTEGQQQEQQPADAERNQLQWAPDDASVNAEIPQTASPSSASSDLPAAASDGAAAGPGTASAEGTAASNPDPVAAARQAEQTQALRQWLEDIPDNPAELLRRKFLYQHLQQQQGSQP